MWLIEEITPAPSTTPSDVTTTHSDVTLENGHRRLTRNTLRRQETLTSPATDYLILMKCSKSVSSPLSIQTFKFLIKNKPRCKMFKIKLHQWQLKLKFSGQTIMSIKNNSFIYQVHCTLDRDQYLFLLRLNQEMTSFVERIILSVTQIFTTNVQVGLISTFFCWRDFVQYFTSEFESLILTNVVRSKVRPTRKKHCQLSRDDVSLPTRC